MAKRRGNVGIAVLIATASLAACSDNADPAAPDATASEDLDELAESLNCKDVIEIDYGHAPIRGLAASRGIRCTTAAGVVHIFDRAAPRSPGSDDPVLQGGSLANIDRLLDVGRVTPGCDISVVVTDHVFVVGASSLLDELGSALGDAVRPPQPASPTVSYLGADCDLTRG